MLLLEIQAEREARRQAAKPKRVQPSKKRTGGAPTVSSAIIPSQGILPPPEPTLPPSVRGKINIALLAPDAETVYSDIQTIKQQAQAIRQGAHLSSTLASPSKINPMQAVWSHVVTKIDTAKRRAKFFFQKPVQQNIKTVVAQTEAKATASVEKGIEKEGASLLGMWNKMPRWGKWGAGIGVGALALGVLSSGGRRRRSRYED